MSMVIDLPKSVENEISDAAAKQGMDAGSFIRAAVEEKLRDLAGMTGPRSTEMEERGGGAAKPHKSRMIQPGMFPQLRDVTEEEFKRAEWRGEDASI